MNVLIICTVKWCVYWIALLLKIPVDSRFPRSPANFKFKTILQLLIWWVTEFSRMLSSFIFYLITLLKHSTSTSCYMRVPSINMSSWSIHCATKKKVHAPEMWFIYCDRYEPIEKPYVRRLSRSKRVAEIWGLKVFIFCYLVIIFSCVTFWMKNFKLTPSIDVITRNIWNFLQNFSFIFCANSEV